MEPSTASTYTNASAFAERLIKRLGPLCKAVYLGGSRVLGFIDGCHDVDIICFYDSSDGQFAWPSQYIASLRANVMRLAAETGGNALNKIVLDADTGVAYDLAQLRDMANEEREYGSYVNRLMVKLAGEDVEFGFDILGKDRGYYADKLRETVCRLCDPQYPLNQKRWYQVCVGTCMLENGSYDLTDMQKEDANVLHGMEPETAERRERLKADLIDRVNRL